MTESFTITVTWPELAILAAIYFAAGAYVCHSLANYRTKIDDLPERQGEDIDLDNTHTQ